MQLGLPFEVTGTDRYLALQEGSIGFDRVDGARHEERLNLAAREWRCSRSEIECRIIDSQWLKNDLLKPHNTESRALRKTWVRCWVTPGVKLKIGWGNAKPSSRVSPT